MEGAGRGSLALPMAEAAPQHPQPWTVEALLTPSARRLALAVVAASFFFPITGLGVDLCMLHAATGLPCPGCGMSRAIAALSQGQWSAALGLNPFALFAWPTFMVLAALAVAPRAWRERVEARVRRSTWAGRVYSWVFFAFVGFGLLRLGVFVVLRERFP